AGKGSPSPTSTRSAPAAISAPVSQSPRATAVTWPPQRADSSAALPSSSKVTGRIPSRQSSTYTHSSVMDVRLLSAQGLRHGLRHLFQGARQAAALAAHGGTAGGGYLGGGALQAHLGRIHAQLLGSQAAHFPLLAPEHPGDGGQPGHVDF